MPLKLKTREQWLNAFVQRAAKHFKVLGYDLPPVRCSIGFSSKGRRSNVIGECWTRNATKDGVHEIFVVPTLEHPSRIADVLTHELVHAAVGIEAKHGPKFRKLATALGLEGKMTATVAGEQWHAWADPVLKAIGPYPAKSMALGGLTSSPPKQTTRMLKCECPECGFVMRTSSKWIETVAGEPTCPDNACRATMRVG